MLLSRAHRFTRTPRSNPTVTSSALLVLAALLPCLLLSVSPVTAVPVIQITSPTDQASVNPTGGPPDLVTVTYTVTGNTCPASRGSFSVAAYVNGTQVSCSGDCGCDGTTQSCNNFTGTLTLDGSAFSSCLNTIELKFNPPPFCPTLCLSLCSNLPPSNTVQVWQSNEGTCTPPKDCNRGQVGKPVDVASGAMYHEVTDLRIQGPAPIEFKRRFDSVSTYDGPMGFGWQHNFLMRLEAGGTGQEVLIDGQARRIYFAKTSGGAWDENRAEHLILTQPGSPPWRVTDKYQTKWEFDAGGRLTKIVDKNGNTVLLGYTGSNLTSIGQDTNIDGTADRAISLAYYGSVPDRIHTITAGGRTVTYTYNAGGNGNLELVQYSDGNSITYEYTDLSGIHRLTKAKDALNHVIEEHTYYNPSGQVHTTQSDSGNYAYTLTYDSPTQTTVTNSLGVDTVYTLDAFQGVVKQRTGPGCTSCGDGGSTVTIQYDEFRNPKVVTDGRGVITEMTYDVKGNVLTRKEAKGTARERTWTFTYHPTFNLPATISIPSVGACSNPNRLVTNSYDSANGDLLNELVVGCNDTTAVSTSTTFTYDGHGQIKTIDGPRSVVPNDVTTYDYYSDADSDPNKRARLQRVTNALGQPTNFSGYDLFGNIGSITDPNSVETTYVYDFMDHITERALPADGIAAEMHYDIVGNPDFLRLPNCVEMGAGCALTTDYTFDSVNRLKELTDPYGNKIAYTYDTEGNRIREEYKDPAAVAQRYTNFEYDTFNRLRHICFAAPTLGVCGSVFSEYGYYADGTRQTEQDPMAHLTTLDYDELKRPSSVTQTVNSIPQTTVYDYDRLDGLKSVTDPAGLGTTYTNGDLGWRLKTICPDNGTTNYGYDLAGNLTSTMNANGVTIGRSYDSLNRLKDVAYPDTTLNVSTTYDSMSVSFGIGRRTGMTYNTTDSVTYGYDRRGHATSEQKTTGGVAFTTGYDYDKSGNLKEIRFPTSDPAVRQGRVDYSYDKGERVSLVETQINGATSTVASGFQYEPFGPRTQLTFGNTLVDARSYDARYQIGNWTLGSFPTYVLDFAHTFNPDGNLATRIDHLDGTHVNDRGFTYDEIHRLTVASGPWGAGTLCAGSTYTYDKNGNRQCKGESGSMTTYSYTPMTNRLASSTGGELASYSYDNNGNITGDGIHNYQFNQADRLATVDSGATSTYTYDGENRRTAKAVPSMNTTLFFFDQSGRLLQEFVPGTGAGIDYIYLLNAPIARVDWSTEQSLGNVLLVTKSSPNLRLDWTGFPSASNTYVVRRKQVTNPNDKSFANPAAIGIVTDPTNVYDDPVLGDANRYDYRVFKRVKVESLYFYHTDHLGTPIAITDGSALLRWRAEYRPFGSLHTLSSSIPNQVRLPGQYEDSSAGLNFNWQRWYSARPGRYSSVDPVGIDSSDTNPFWYASANPIGRVDRNGMLSVRAANPAGCACWSWPGIDRSVRELCNADRLARIDKADESEVPGPLKSCLRRKCTDSTIEVTCDSPDCKGAAGFIYPRDAGPTEGQQRDPNLGRMTLCPSGLSGRSGRPIGSIVFHEASHLCGYDLFGRFNDILALHPTPECAACAAYPNDQGACDLCRSTHIKTYDRP